MLPHWLWNVFPEETDVQFAIFLMIQWSVQFVFGFWGDIWNVSVLKIEHYHSYSFSLCILCLICTAMHLCFEVYCRNVICDAIIIIIIVLFIEICINERYAHRVITGTQSWSQIQCYNGSFWNLTAALLSSFPSLRKQSHLIP